MIEAERLVVLHIATDETRTIRIGGAARHHEWRRTCCRPRSADERLGAHPVVFEDLFGIGHTSGHGSRDLPYEFSDGEASSTIVSAAHDAAPSLTLANPLLSEWRPEY